jgi:hypothetical protein
MKNTRTLLVLALIMIIGLAFANMASAQEVVLDTKIEQMAVQKDKNGNEYVRFIIKEVRTLNGIDYEAEVVTMAFGGTVADAKELKTGDTLKAIASVNEYQGRKNYSLIQILQ